MKTRQEKLEEQIGIVRSAVAEIESIQGEYAAHKSNEEIWLNEDDPKIEQMENEAAAVQDLAEELETALTTCESALDI